MTETRETEMNVIPRRGPPPREVTAEGDDAGFGGGVGSGGLGGLAGGGRGPVSRLSPVRVDHGHHPRRSRRQDQDLKTKQSSTPAQADSQRPSEPVHLLRRPNGPFAEGSATDASSCFSPGGVALASFGDVESRHRVEANAPSDLPGRGRPGQRAASRPASRSQSSPPTNLAAVTAQESASRRPQSRSAPGFTSLARARSRANT